MVCTGNWRCSVWMLAAVWVVAGVVASPVKRATGDVEARRRSAVERSAVRFGRSYPAQPSAADIREALQRSLRSGNTFLRLGRSQSTLSLTPDDLITLLRSYDDEEVSKRGANFLRFGRDPQFIRFGRSQGEQDGDSTDSDGGAYQQRKGRARDHFLRLGRDSEELNDVMDDDVDRQKRSVQPCDGCQS